MPPHAGVVLVVMVLVAPDVDGVDDGLGLLGGLNGAVQGFLAAPILSVGQDDDGLAAGLFFGNFIAGKENRVVEFRPGPAPGSGAVRS